MKQDFDIEKLFSEASEKIEFGVPRDEWSSLHLRLDKYDRNKRRRGVFFWLAGLLILTSMSTLFYFQVTQSRRIVSDNMIGDSRPVISIIPSDAAQRQVPFWSQDMFLNQSQLNEGVLRRSTLSDELNISQDATTPMRIDNRAVGSESSIENNIDTDQKKTENERIRKINNSTPEDLLKNKKLEPLSKGVLLERVYARSKNGNHSELAPSIQEIQEKNKENQLRDDRMSMNLDEKVVEVKVEKEKEKEESEYTEREGSLEIAVDEEISKGRSNVILPLALVTSSVKVLDKTKDLSSVQILKLKASEQSVRPWAVSSFIGMEYNNNGELISSIGTFKYGFGASRIIGKHWEIKTGFRFCTKLFIGQGSNFKRNNWYKDIMPSEMDGKCMIYEIPLTIAYYFNSVSAHSFYVNAGMNAYIFYSEWYGFDYSEDLSEDIKDKLLGEINNTNSQALAFDIGEIGVGYQYRINKWLYADMYASYQRTITGIGEGKVKLNTQTLSIGLTARF